MRRMQLLMFVLIFINLNVFSQELKIDRTKKPLKEIRIKTFSFGASLVTAKMLFYDDYSSLFFINAESEQIEREFYSFTLSNEDMNRLYELLIKNDANSEDKYKIETLKKGCYVLIDYKIVGRKSYGKLRLYTDENDLTGVRLTKMPKNKLRKLFDQTKKKKRRN